ncbi:hypothetical protein [Paracraurococcus ruber]|uniref:Hydratase n=1 Tax=Paracraurococcus ruber TaxID=77675 RepID=A0ABS1CRJ6_9PROT|nr:hypothetical protein [Paracraurococcus ruber]MBK1657054.1 hypothetical protein [Paracraurococcus ruber]TDG31470.1 hypothetical protein E2C05_10850 [Paracraurococcus ruber]
MDAILRDSAARCLADAVASGQPIGPLPPLAMPRSMLDGQRIAARVLDMLDLPACGLRLGPPANGKPVPGPVLEGRVLPSGSTISMTDLRHARASAAIVGILAEDLPRRGDEMPVFATLHPAIDVGSWRLQDPPSTGALAAADLAGLGYIAIGKGKRGAPTRLRVALAPAGTWRRGEEMDLEAPILAVAMAARRAGGLPAGAMLVAPIGPAVDPAPGLELHAALGRLGRAELHFA